MPPASTPGSRGESRATAVRARVSAAEGRFAAGMLLAGRYQIIGLLGRGGMGEVYRANDRTLDQPVALKFLPAAMAQDAGMLARFYNEVRIARQVSHPNVCRVYDIGEVDGQPYLSMEYIDGEDLGSLLRRIGRLPAAKALEFARRICAGLAAAHEKGVLHRDLKPSNIMIDSQGQVFITDFGLASVTGELRETQAREGTPAYMAPEQLAGRDVTARSDIYALGLVLYEMFAGTRPFQASTLAELIRLQQDSTPASLSETVSDVDPAAERVIARCLAPDPHQRPSSALAVAAALPGGDPLAAALAAGETPSPELVAAAGQETGIRPAIAVACLAFTIAALIGILLLGARTQMIGRITMEYPPDVLIHKSREIARSLGYTAKPAGVAHGFDYDHDYLQYVQRIDKSPARWEQRLRNAQPPPIIFWYRESPRPLEPQPFALPLVTPGDPPPLVSGMFAVYLDPQGRLGAFEAQPPQIDDSSGPAPPLDWKRLFDAAGLDMARFSVTPPKWTPLGICDARAAWIGPFGAENHSVRVEAAAWHGKPIFFEIIGPWTRPERMQTFQFSSAMKTGFTLAIVLMVTLVLAAALLARQNLRHGRGDRRGAIRLAALTSTMFMLVWALLGDHVMEPGELLLVAGGAGYALLLGSAVWIFYIAIEPFARRRWPQCMITWNRLLAGGFRDPLLGRDVLVGLSCGLAGGLLYKCHELVAMRLGETPSIQVFLNSLLGVRQALATLVVALADSVISVLIWFVLLLLLRLLLRREWLAAAAFVLLYGILGALLATAAPLLSGLSTAAGISILVFVMLRFGLVALFASAFAYEASIMFPITSDFSAWYAGTSLFALLTLGAIAAFAFHSALAGRPLFERP